MQKAVEMASRTTKLDRTSKSRQGARGNLLWDSERIEAPRMGELQAIDQLESAGGKAGPGHAEGADGLPPGCGGCVPGEPAPEDGPQD